MGRDPAIHTFKSDCTLPRKATLDTYSKASLFTFIKSFTVAEQNPSWCYAYIEGCEGEDLAEQGLKNDTRQLYSTRMPNLQALQ